MSVNDGRKMQARVEVDQTRSKDLFVLRVESGLSVTTELRLNRAGMRELAVEMMEIIGEADGLKPRRKR